MKKTVFGLLVFVAVLASHESDAQLLPTKLQVTVRNDLGNVVEGATVLLFKTEADYDKSENFVGEAVTDRKGRVIFKDLEPISYYMHVEKGDLTNIGLGVKTVKLVSKKKNKLNVIIE